ncbi:MAG: carbamoyl-phosphate synthase large subunit, partial [Candidatus Azotimanducaceae bacterium WSBS_2022_MAG_OTU7]
MPASTRTALLEASIKMASHASYRGVGTFEFLVNADQPDEYYFIEANARLQVEHTVTEAITGLDLVALQLQIAAGKTLDDLGLKESPATDGYAIQCRINMETPGKKGMFKPTGGTINLFEPPSGPGIRVDTFGYAGYKTSTRYDSLLAKLIVHSKSADFSVCAEKTV